MLTTLSYAHCYPKFIEVGSPRAVGSSPHVADMCKSTTYDLQRHIMLPVLLLAVTIQPGLRLNFSRNRLYPLVQTLLNGLNARCGRH